MHKKIEGKWMANLGCLISMDRNHGLNIRDDARPKQNWNWLPNFNPIPLVQTSPITQSFKQVQRIYNLMHY